MEMLMQLGQVLFAKNDLSKLNIIAVNRDKTNSYTFKPNGTTGYTLASAKLLTATALNSDVFSETNIAADVTGNYTISAMGILILEYALTPLSLTPCPTVLSLITGTSNICVNATTTLTNNTVKPNAAIGTWSSVAGRATINATTGLLTGTSVGTRNN